MTLKEDAVKLVGQIRASGHHHTYYNGRIETIGSTECGICKPAIDLAEKAEEEAKFITRANWIDPKIQPCEVCGEPHQNYECCDKCNHDNHICHFCGDNLGHTEVSVCYITID